jgi:hypothetical protein
MWLAISDIDSDGDLDLLFSNTWESIPSKLLQWDSNNQQNVTSDYLVLENKWDFKFNDITSEIFENRPWFWWGIIPIDFNLDNKDDYLFHQNYIKWPLHKISKLSGLLLENIADKSFNNNISSYNLENTNYWFSSLIWDINNDWLDDVIYLNIDGKAKAFLRESDVNNQYLKILLPDDLSSKNLTAIFQTNTWKIYTKKHLSKQGIMTDQSSSMILWLNGHNFINWTLTIKYNNWEEKIYTIDRETKILNLRWEK